MSNKYAGQLFNPKDIKSNRLNVIYAPMGSGKTTLFHDLLNKYKCLMIAPYRSCREDFGLPYTYSKTNGGLNHKFLYPKDLIAAVTEGWVSASDLTDEVTIKNATVDYVKNLPPVSFTHILFDEVDFMWWQAEKTEIGSRKLRANDARIWEYILKALADKFILIGQTSTIIPTLGILKVGGQIQKGAHTSVRFDSITPVLVSKAVNHNQLFKMAMDKAIKENVKQPTLVYKSKFSESDIYYMEGMVKKGLRVLVVLRKQNSPIVYNSISHPIYVLTHIGAIDTMIKGITSRDDNLHYTLIGEGAALNKITPSADPYMFFDYIFINTSSSRQVSLNAVRGDENTKVRVITIGTELNSTSHQAAGRFRQNRVEIIHYLKRGTKFRNYVKEDVASFSGLNLWTKLLDIDLTMDLYMKHKGVRRPNSSLSGVAKDSQLQRQAEWLGKSVKGKANPIQAHRQSVFDKWFKAESSSSQPNFTLKGYTSYCTTHGENPYSKNKFSEYLKKAKKRSTTGNP